MCHIRNLLLILLTLVGLNLAMAEDGYDLWLRYRPVADPALREQYRHAITGIRVEGKSETLQAAAGELRRGLSGLLGQDLPAAAPPLADGTLIAGTPSGSALVRRAGDGVATGYCIRSVQLDGKRCTLIAGANDVQVLYGVFHFLRLLQTRQAIAELKIAESPAIARRILDHWDNPNGSIERGYAGRSLWKWDELPARIDPRIIDYARANASIGINGAVLNNVNAKALNLSSEYLQKTAALAGALRPWGIRVYLSPRFTAPLELGKLATADPLDPAVAAWWQAKADEVYRLIPDFGGFLIKANSEGQPGPQDYGRTHAEGANMLARALAPHGGIVMWRAFVYGRNGLDPDRVKQPYQGFTPLDGKFDPNVFVQVKNGPLDFQPREPVHPLFGAMPRTPLAAELQITQEYLGHSTFLVYLAPMWKEVLDFDTFARGQGSTVARIIDGSLEGHRDSAIAGVANTGSDRNWCGHDFAQANWYAFGRLAWNHALDPRAIAEEWTRMTLTNDSAAVKTIVGLMMNSWEDTVDTMTPLGLSILCASRDHYNPDPAHRRSAFNADARGIGLDRTRAGSDAVSQYASPVRDLFNDPAACPEKYLLWFHHVPWERPLKSGRTLWDELCFRYACGAGAAVQTRQTWGKLRSVIDPETFQRVDKRLALQERDAALWRDTCLKEFQKSSRRPIAK